MTVPRSLIRPPIAVPLVLLVMAITLLVLSQDFGKSSGMFPRFIGWIFVGLTAADLLVQLWRWLSDRQPEPTERSVFIKQIQAFSWLIGLVVLVCLVGFLVAIPLYILTYLRLRARQGLPQALAISIGILVFVLVIFVWLLNYDLYAGWIFSALS